jgi:uncharacterized damage-inducible protein DinB
MNELNTILEIWDDVAEGTLAVMRALPADQYDFRPDTGGRSIGELAWHLAELDGYVSYAIQRGAFDGEKPPNIARPKTIDGLAPGYDVVHREAVARVTSLTDADLDRSVTYVDGKPVSIRDVLWRKLLLHAAHHRGQLVLLARLAGGVPPGVAGRTREEAAAQRAAQAAAV